MDQLTNIFKILSDESRLRIMVLLAQEPLCVCELSGILSLSQPKVSKALSKMKDMGLVVDDRKEKFVFYHLNKNAVFLTQTLDNILKQVDQYPVLLADSARLSQKELYLATCVPNHSNKD